MMQNVLKTIVVWRNTKEAVANENQAKSTLTHHLFSVLITPTKIKLMGYNHEK